MKKSISTEKMLESFNELALITWALGDKNWQKKVQKPLIILWRTGIALGILPFFYHWPKYQWVALVYILCFFLVSYFIFLWKINTHAKTRLREINIQSDASFFKHWYRKDMEGIQEKRFIDALKIEFNLDVYKISLMEIGYYADSCYKKAEEFKKVIPPIFNPLLAMASLALSIGFNLIEDKNEKVNLVVGVILSSLFLLFAFKTNKDIIEKSLNTKSKKYREMFEIFETIRLNRVINENSDSKLNFSCCFQKGNPSLHRKRFVRNRNIHE